MRNAIDYVYGKIFISGLLLFMMGCAGDPVPTHLPANHPANPDAAEAAYAVVPNPFQDSMPMSEMKSKNAPPMSPGRHRDSHSQTMAPGRNKPEESEEIKTEKSGHSH